MDRTKNKVIFYITLGLLVAAGVLFRVLFFSYARPFWNDECALALNLLNRNFIQLFAPLDFSQVTPPLYAFVCKFCAVFSKQHEIAFRLPSLIFGLLSVIVFCLLSLKALKSKAAVLFANMLFVLNYQLIYFSQELKHYACDVFCFCVILLFVFYVDKIKDNFKLLVATGILFALSVWFSYTASFALFAVFLILQKLSKKQLFALFVLPGFSLVMFAIYTFRLHTDGFLNDFWTQGFIAKNFSNILSLCAANLAYYFEDFRAKIIIVIMFVAGLYVLFKNIKVKRNLVLAIPFLTAFALSYFKIYPLYLRTAIYLFPVFVLVLSLAFQNLWCKRKPVYIFASIVLGMMFFMSSIATDYRLILQKHYYREDTKNLLQLFEKESNNKCTLIVPYSSSINFEYYKNSVSDPSQNIYVLKTPLYEQRQIKEVYDLLPSNRCYYILFTHSADKPYVFKNLSAYAGLQKNARVFSDEHYNALIKFEK